MQLNIKLINIMIIKRKKISTSEEYISFVRRFVTLLDTELKFYEDKEKNKKDLSGLARQMPAIISLVNTVGYLRGQDGIFLGTRPSTENQNELRKYEDFFENRLNKLIDILISSDLKKSYQERLESYFVKSRTKQKATII